MREVRLSGSAADSSNTELGGNRSPRERSNGGIANYDGPGKYFGRLKHLDQDKLTPAMGWRQDDKGKVETSKDKGLASKISERATGSLRHVQQAAQVATGLYGELKGVEPALDTRQREKFVDPLPDALPQVVQDEFAKQLGESFIERLVEFCCDCSMCIPIVRLLIAADKHLFRDSTKDSGEAEGATDQSQDQAMLIQAINRRMLELDQEAARRRARDALENALRTMHQHSVRASPGDRTTMLDTADKAGKKLVVNQGARIPPAANSSWYRPGNRERTDAYVTMQRVVDKYRAEIDPESTHRQLVVAILARLRALGLSGDADWSPNVVAEFLAVMIEYAILSDMRK